MVYIFLGLARLQVNSLYIVLRCGVIIKSVACVGLFGRKTKYSGPTKQKDENNRKISAGC